MSDAMLNSQSLKLWRLLPIVRHTSPEMIMKNYAGFIKDNHLRIDTSINMFKNLGNTLGDTYKIDRLKRA
jgi:integrase